MGKILQFTGKVKSEKEIKISQMREELLSKCTPEMQEMYNKLHPLAKVIQLFPS